MSATSFSNLTIIAAVAFAAPLVLGSFPQIRLPSVVLELVFGIAIGPSGLGWVTADLPVQILSLIGLAFLLFLAGLDVEVERLQGRLLRLAGAGFVLSVSLALVVSVALRAAGQVHNLLFVAIILSATAVGLVAPVLKDAGLSSSSFGQLVLAGATAADFGTIILLSLFFSGQTSGFGARLALLGSFAALVATVGLVLIGARRFAALSGLLVRLQDTTAQIRVRGAVLLLIGFAAMAERFGLQIILGAFIAGVVLRIVDRDATASHPRFRPKLDGVGYGFLIPIFFVTSGVQFDLSALLSSPSTIVRVPTLLLAILVVRGVPAILYRRVLGNRQTVAAGLLQATSLSFIVAATAIGIALGQITEATGAALVGAGLLSVVIFPGAALFLLGKGEPGAAPTAAKEC
jgi:Kef-type K+ transport system membrane component KefB